MARPPLACFVRIVGAALLTGLVACSDSTGPGPSSFAQPAGDSVFVGRSFGIVSLSTFDHSVITAAPYKWSSSDPAVAVVDAAGTVFGLGTGRAIITAELDGHRNSLAIRIVAFRADGGAQFDAAAKGSGQNCALQTSGALYCRSVWAVESLAGFAPLGGSIQFTSLSTALSHACGLTAAGVMYCWGNNASGALATRSTSVFDTPVPMAVAGSVRFLSVTAGGLGTTADFTCGINRADSVAYCADHNGDDQTAV